MNAVYRHPDCQFCNRPADRACARCSVAICQSHLEDTGTICPGCNAALVSERRRHARREPSGPPFPWSVAYPTLVAIGVGLWCAVVDPTDLLVIAIIFGWQYGSWVLDKWELLQTWCRDRAEFRRRHARWRESAMRLSREHLALRADQSRSHTYGL